MALVTVTLDPDAEYLSADAVIAKINAAVAQITRGGCVHKNARPIEAKEVGTTEINDNAVGHGQCSVTLAKDNLDAMVDVNRGYLKTSPTSGEYKIISAQRAADGKIEITYDDTPEE